MQEAISAATLQIPVTFSAIAMPHIWHLGVAKGLRLTQEYDRRFKPEQPVCMHNVLCECNRRHCEGKTVSTRYYVRQVMKST